MYIILLIINVYVAAFVKLNTKQNQREGGVLNMPEKKMGVRREGEEVNREKQGRGRERE